MTITESRILDGQIIDYTKSPIPYMDARFAANSCTIQQEGVAEKTSDAIAAKSENKPLWVEPKDVVKKKEAKLKEEKELDTIIKKVVENSNIAPVILGAPFARDMLSDIANLQTSSAESAHENIKASLMHRKDALMSLEDKTIEIKATINTIDWVLSLFNKE